MQERGHIKHEVTLIQIFASVGAALCFTVALALFIRKLFGKLSSCCRDLFGKKSKERPDVSEKKFEKKYPNLRYEPLRVSHKNRPHSLSIENLESYKNTPFEIPGMVTCETIQPNDIHSTTSGYSTASGMSHAESFDSTLDNKVFVDEYIQPTERENCMRSAGLKILRSSAFIRRGESTDEGLDTVIPELYESNYRRTQGPGELGKIRFSLQYEDKTKRKLIMTLIDLNNLLFQRGMEHVSSLYISAILLPERDYRFQSQLLPRSNQIKLEDVFIFHSRPHNRDFEARTVHLTIMYVEKSGKEITYGESRMALLSHEIYSQVPTELSVGIKSATGHLEIGDAQICLSYSGAQKKLNVMVKILKFSGGVLDNLTGLHIKAHLSRLGGDRLGKKRTISKNLGATKSMNAVEFQEHMCFDLETENFALCTLKLNIHGRHKIMRKHISLGKIRIGEANRDSGGKTHWKTVLNSEGIGWTMWHVIYSA